VKVAAIGEKETPCKIKFLPYLALSIQSHFVAVYNRTKCFNCDIIIPTSTFEHPDKTWEGVEAMRQKPIVQDITDKTKDKEVWFVGDIHGRIHLLKMFLDHIQFDPRRHVIVSVGDLIDRGEGNVEVLNFFRQFGYAVRGNHERMWLEMVEHYGVLPYDDEGHIHPSYAHLVEPYLRSNGHWESLIQFSKSNITAQEWIDFMESLPTALIVGDYLVVHAGVYPYKHWDDHTEEKLVWVRDEYLFRKGEIPEESRLGKRLVTGHTETWRLPGGLGKAFVDPDRILLDVGAASNVGFGAYHAQTGEELFFPGPCLEKVRELMTQGSS
jgi:serine/threonine protein phosphatase 1